MKQAGPVMHPEKDKPPRTALLMVLAGSCNEWHQPVFPFECVWEFNRQNGSFKF